MPKKILITGGAGFIGSYLAEKLLEQGEEVFVLDDLSTGTTTNIKHLKKKYNEKLHFLYRKGNYRDLFELDLDNFNDEYLKGNNRGERRPISVLDKIAEVDPFVGEIIKNKKINEIYHLAASVGVKLILKERIRSILNNIEGTDIVLSEANGKREGREIKILIASSSELYGKNNSLPFKENNDRTYGSTYSHRWAYAESKAIDEYLALAYNQNPDYKLPVIIVRFFNVIGPKQTGYYGMVVPTFVWQALEKEDLTVYGDGEQTRCFADVEDVVGALIKLMAEKEAVGKVINLGSDREISINELAEKIKEQTKSPSKIVYIPYEQAYGAGFEDLRRRIPDLTQIKKLIDYQPKITLEESLKKIIEHFNGR